MATRAPVLVREATPADATGIGEVHAAAWRSAYRDVFEAGWLERLATKRRDRWPDLMVSAEFTPTTVLVAQRGQRIVAFVHFGPDDAGPDDLSAARIHSCYATPAEWGSGVAATLLDDACQHIAEAGYGLVRLRTLAGANRARRFYAREGFRETGFGREHDFGDGRPVLQVEYERAISDPTPHAPRQASTS